MRIENVKFRPKRSDAFATCEAASGRCACKDAGTNPCHAWHMHLIDCHTMKLDPASAELGRIDHNRRTGEMQRFASMCNSVIRARQ